MSVLIKGMKMPQACTKCLFFIESYSPSFPFVECKFIGRLGSVFNFNNDVPIDCPLIELPPHGDLIDRDALIKSLDKLCNRVCQYSKAQRKVMCSACPLGHAFTVIEDDAPTILEAEVEE